MDRQSPRPGWRPEWKRKERKKPGAKPRGASKTDRPKDTPPANGEEDQHPPAKPRTVEELRPWIEWHAERRVPWGDIAGGLGVSLEFFRAPGRTLQQLFDEYQRNLQERAGLVGSALADGVLLGSARVCARAYQAARDETIPRMHWSKCHLKFRETGEREMDEKPKRQIRQVTFRLIKGGADVAGELGAGPGGSAAGSSALDGASADDGRALHRDSRGPRRGEELGNSGLPTRGSHQGSGPEHGVPSGGAEEP